MLTPDRLKPYLLHPDKYLRRAAVDYFAESWSQDPDILPAVLDAHDRYGGDEEMKRSLYVCDHFALTEASVGRVLDHLARSDNENAITDLNRVLVRAPTGLLTAHETAIRENPKVLPETRSRLERRRDLAGWTGERLWEELQAFARRNRDQWEVGKVDLSYSEDLVDALVRHDVPDVETVGRLLREREPEAGWLEIFLVELAGERRITRAVPALVDKFHIDTDYLLECSKDALAQIGDPEAVRLIRAAYPAAEDDFRLFTSDIFGAIKHEESEAAILALLETERDPTYRTILCLGLCDLFSERGVEAVTREIEAGYDESYTRLEEDLLPVLEVLGIDLPEVPRWKLERAERERRLKARLAEDWGPGWPLDALMTHRFDVAASPGAAGGTVLDTGSAPAAAPVRRTEQRAGRNDPCPCGSGKKYKKCCGRSG